MTEADAKNKVEETTVEPFIELPVQAQKIRRNLLICCILSIAVFFGGQISTAPTGLGMRVDGLPLEYLSYPLGVVTVYFYIYFIWTGWETYWKWRLRRSAKSRLERMKSGGSAFYLETDYSFSQDTAIRWFKDTYDQIDEKTKSVLAVVQKLDVVTAVNENHLARLERVSQDMSAALNNFEKSANRAARFSDSFWSYQKALRINWIIEYWIPLIVGAICIIGLIVHWTHGPFDWPWINTKQKIQEISGFCR